MPLSRPELEILQGLPVIPRMRAALELLGVLARRSPDAIALARCLGPCGALTRLTDLYGGHCRTCAGLAPTPGNGAPGSQEPRSGHK